MTGRNQLHVFGRGVGTDFAAFECLLYAICSAVPNEVVEVLDVRETRVVTVLTLLRQPVLMILTHK
jgi:hypothetical protein